MRWPADLRAVDINDLGKDRMNFRIQAGVLAVCVAASLSLPAQALEQALETDAHFGGTFAYSLSQFNSDATGEDFDAENNGSFLGLSASIAQDGIKAFVIYERGFDRYNADSTNTESEDYVREFFGGVEGRYGRLTAGRQSSFYKKTGRQVDPFYDTSAVGFNGQFANEGASFGLSNLSNGFTSNSVAYESPALLGGLKVRGGVFVSDNDEPADDEDFSAGLLYENSGYGFSAGVEFLDSAGPVVFGFPAPGGTAYRVYGGFRPVEVVSFALSYESVDVDETPDARGYLFAATSFTLSPKLKIALSYGKTDKTPFDGDGVTLGAFYEIIPRLTAYVAGRSVELDGGDDTNTVATGFSFDFDIDLN